MPDLAFAIKAEDQTGEGISKVKRDLDEAGNSAEGAGGKFGGLTEHMKLLVGATLGLGAAFEGKKLFGESVNAAEELSQSVSKLQRTVGGTTEDASRLSFALKESIGAVGGNADNANMALSRFAKGIAGLQENEDGTVTSSSTLIKQLQGMGITTQDAAGKTLPMTDVLGKLADKFQTMPDGAEKTSLAMQLFGRQGVDLIPFLNKGADGIAEMEKESDKLGLTLSQNTIQQTQKLTAAQMKLHEAGEGLKVQLGVALLPMLADGAVRAADWATAFDEKVLPAVTKTAGFLSGALSQGFRDVMNVIAPYGDAIDTIFGKVEGLLDRIGTKSKTAGQEVVQGISSMIPGFGIITGLVPGLTAKLGEWADALIGKVMPVVKELAGWLEHQLSGALQFVVDNAPKVLAALEGLAKSIAATVLPALKTLGSLLTDTVVPTIRDWASQLGDKLGPVISTVNTFLHEHETAVKNVAIALVAVASPIVALIAAIVLIRQHWDELNAKLQEFKPILDAIRQQFEQLASAVLKEMQPLLDWWQQQFMPELRADAGAISEFFQQKIIPAIQAVISFIQQHWAQIEDLFRGPLEIVKAMVQARFDSLRVIIEGALRVIGDVIIAVMAIIHGDWGTAWDKIKDIPVAIFDTLKSLIGIALTELEGILSGAWDTIKAVAGLAWDGLKTAIEATVSALLTELGNLPSQMLAALGDLAHLLYQAGVDLIQGLINGVESMASKVTGAMGDLAGKAKKAFTDPLSIFSPSKVMEEVGRDITDGLVNGITAGAPAVYDAMSQLSTGVIGRAGDMATAVKGGGDGGGGGGGFSPAVMQAWALQQQGRSGQREFTPAEIAAGMSWLYNPQTGQVASQAQVAQFYANAGGTASAGGGSGGRASLGVASAGGLSSGPGAANPYANLPAPTVQAGGIAGGSVPAPSYGGGGVAAVGLAGGAGGSAPSASFSGGGTYGGGIAKVDAGHGFVGGGRGVFGGTFTYQELAHRWRIPYHGGEAEAQRAVEAFLGTSGTGSGPNWNAAIPLPTAAQTALASLHTATASLPVASAGGGGAAPTFVINISAMDAAGVLSAMPQVTRQIDLYLKQNGQVGILR